MGQGLTSPRKSGCLARKSLAISLVVMTAAVGWPLPIGFPTVTMSGFTPTPPVSQGRQQHVVSKAYVLEYRCIYKYILRVYTQVYKFHKSKFVYMRSFIIEL